MLSHARAGSGRHTCEAAAQSGASGGGGSGGSRKASQQSAVEQHYLAELRKFIEEKGECNCNCSRSHI